MKGPVYFFHYCSFQLLTHDNLLVWITNNEYYKTKKGKVGWRLVWNEIIIICTGCRLSGGRGRLVALFGSAGGTPRQGQGLLLHHVADYYSQAAVELVDQGLIETHRRRVQHGPSMSFCRNSSFPSSSSCESPRRSPVPNHSPSLEAYNRCRKV